MGGGNYITRSAPTNFHQFWTQKILTASESIEDFKEVTEAEKTALVASDALWVRAPQSFIDMWNEACIDNFHNLQDGRYNEATGYFELNGLTDITYEQALLIIRSSSYWCRSPLDTMPNMAMLPIRTHFTLTGHGNGIGAVTMNNTFKYCRQLETVNIRDGNYEKFVNTFYACKKLKVIYIKSSYYIKFNDSAFDDCVSLVDLFIAPQIKSNINLKWSPKLSLDSIQNIVNKLESGKSWIFTLHPEAYARVTDEIFALAAEKSITIATT